MTACAAFAHRPCSLRLFAAPSRLRHRGPRAASTEPSAASAHSFAAFGPSRCRAPDPPTPTSAPSPRPPPCLQSRSLSNVPGHRGPPPLGCLRRIRPPPAWPLALRRAARPVRQLPHPRQAPARRLACKAAAGPTSTGIAGRLRRGARQQPNHRRLAACGLSPRRPACAIAARGPPRCSKRHSPHWPIACAASVHRPRGLWPFDARGPGRQLPHPRQAPARRLACKAAAGPTPPGIAGRLDAPNTATAAVRRPRHRGSPPPMRPPAAEPPPRPHSRAATSTRAAQFGIIAGGTASSRRARHRAHDDATARRRGDAMARQRGGGIAACAARPAAPAPGLRRAPPQPGSSQTSRGETP